MFNDKVLGFGRSSLSACGVPQLSPDGLGSRPEGQLWAKVMSFSGNMINLFPVYPYSTRRQRSAAEGGWITGSQGQMEMSFRPHLGITAHSKFYGGEQGESFGKLLIFKFDIDLPLDLQVVCKTSVSC